MNYEDVQKLSNAAKNKIGLLNEMCIRDRWHILPLEEKTKRYKGCN